MNRQQLIFSSTLASALARGLLDAAVAADLAGKEKCFGIARASQNDCANLSGTHSCAGQRIVRSKALNPWR